MYAAFQTPAPAVAARVSKLSVAAAGFRTNSQIVSCHAIYVRVLMTLPCPAAFCYLLLVSILSGALMCWYLPPFAL
jgi:hypothetical protein